MKTKLNKLLLSLGLVAASSLRLSAEEPSGDQLLHQMSDKLAAAKTYRFEATREMDLGLIEGVQVAERVNITVSVQRPSKIAARATSTVGVRRFIADGQTLSLLDEKENLYATVPMPTSLDGLVEQLDEKYGFTPPLAEFARSDIYKEFHQQADTVTYLGQVKLEGGVECHHLALKGKEADAELWIALSDLLPRKLVAAFHREGNPQVRIEFSAWNLAASVSESDFSFTAPKGAEKIEMWTTAKMQEASKP